jgi:hypothetical protein
VETLDEDLFFIFRELYGEEAAQKTLQSHVHLNQRRRRPQPTTRSQDVDVIPKEIRALSAHQLRKLNEFVAADLAIFGYDPILPPT